MQSIQNNIFSTRVCVILSASSALTDLPDANGNIVVSNAYSEDNDIKKREELKKSLATWLSSPDPSITHNRLLGEHHDGTGEWFVQSEEFCAWKMSPCAMLWIQGIPGNGKSVLCSTIVKHLESEAMSLKIPLLYYYFNFREPSTQTCENFIRSLVFQLLHYLPSIPDALENIYMKCNKGTRRPSLDDLTETLITMINSQEEVRLLGDAFDECSEWNALWGFMSALRQRNCRSLRFLFTSRPEGYIRDAFGPWNIAVVDLRCPEINRDIEKYVSEVLQNEPRFWRITDEGKDLIRNDLVSRANGMFRWASLQLDELAKCRTMKALRLALSSLPITLDETYSRILNRVEDGDRSYVYHILQCLCVAIRDLTIEEVIGIYIVGDKLQPPFEYEDMLFNPQCVLDAFGGLLSLSKRHLMLSTLSRTFISEENFQAKEQPVERRSHSGQESNPFTFVHLSHFSVKEYLLSPRASTWQVHEMQCHVSLIRSCVASYLELASIPCDSQTTWTYSTYSLPCYLVNCITKHLNALQPREPSDLMDSIRLLLLPTGNFHFRLGRWLDIQDLSKYLNLPSYRLSSDYDGTVPFKDLCGIALSFAARWGLPNILKWLLDEYELDDTLDLSVSIQNLTFGPPLVEAVEAGHFSTIKLILDSGADIDASGRNGPALHYAVRNGDLPLVKLLVHRGANHILPIRDVFDLRWRPHHFLLIAAYDSAVEMAQAVVDAGVDVNTRVDAQGQHSYTALQAAVERGHVQLVKKLIELDADVDLIGAPRSVAPIQLAAIWDRKEIVEVLVGAGANVDTRAGIGGLSAIQHARRMQLESSDQIVMILLEAGAEDLYYEGSEDESDYQSFEEEETLESE